MDLELVADTVDVFEMDIDPVEVSVLRIVFVIREEDEIVDDTVLVFDIDELLVWVSDVLVDVDILADLL